MLPRAVARRACHAIAIEGGEHVTDCCRTAYEDTADRQFNTQKVAQEVARYRVKGPGPTTRLLADGIARAGMSTGTVLDVGAGFGALTFTLLDRGVTNATAVDASAAYVEAARDEASRRGLANAIRIVHADFVAAADELPPAGIVALDRVVCCYPSCDRLLDAALSRARHCLALSYPRNVWYVEVGLALDNGLRWLKRNPFRTFVHPKATIAAAMARAGFRLSNRRETWVWSADVYVRDRDEVAVPEPAAMS
jgi:SAM-dependent methyltransferase